LKSNSGIEDFRIMSARDVAVFCGVSYQTVLDWINTRELTSIHPPTRSENGGRSRRNHLIDSRDLEAFLLRHRDGKVATTSATNGAGKTAQTGANPCKNRTQVYEKNWYVKR
jgi:transposase